MNSYGCEAVHCEQFVGRPSATFRLITATLVVLGCSLAATAFGYQEPKQRPVLRRWFVVVNVSATQNFRLSIVTAIGKDHLVLLERALGAEHTKEMESIVATIVEQFDLPPLDEKGQVAGADQPSTQVIFLIRQSTKNRRREIWFGRDEAEQLGMQAAIEKLIAIVNEEIGPTTADAELREFQGILKSK
jgi:hypothetical protein